MAARYYHSHIFTTDEEMPEAEARESGSYVAHHVGPGAGESRAECFLDGKLVQVTYYGKDRPDDALASEHRRRYDCPFVVEGRKQTVGAVSVIRSFYVASSGETQHIKEVHIDAADNVQREVMLDAAGTVTSSVEYTYDQSGDLLQVRELDRNGLVMSEEIYDEDGPLP